MNFVKEFLFRSPCDYNKIKVNYLKAFLPLMIIIHHANSFFEPRIDLPGRTSNIAMFMFFAMSGFGLVISFKKNESYINGFLIKSAKKLFTPYLVTLFLFVIYRIFEGVNQLDLLKTEGLFSFVPTSWYLFVLFLFYLFFFLVFSLCKKSDVVKVLLTSFFVIVYMVVAPYVGIEPWRYKTCSAFCVGMFFALFDGSIKKKFFTYHLFLAFVVTSIAITTIILTKKSCFAVLEPLLFPTALFTFMYCVPNLKNFSIIQFFSSISLEMYIIQFIPIYIVTGDLNVKSPYLAFPLIVVCDVVLAYAIHFFIKKFQRKGLTS